MKDLKLNQSIFLFCSYRDTQEMTKR